MKIGTSAEIAGLGTLSPVLPSRVAVGLALLYSDQGYLMIRNAASKNRPEISGKWGLPSCRLAIEDGVQVIDGFRQSLHKKYGLLDLAVDQVVSYPMDELDVPSGSQGHLSGFLMSGRAITPGQLRRKPSNVVAAMWQRPEQIIDGINNHFITPYSARILGLAGAEGTGVTRVA